MRDAHVHARMADRQAGGARQAEGSAPAYRIIPSDMRCGWMVGAVTCEQQGRGLLLGYHRPEDYTTPNGGASTQGFHMVERTILSPGRMAGD